MSLPKEVAACPNLKHINLLENNNIDWKQSSQSLSKLNATTGLYVSIADLSDIPQIHWKNITGIEILKKKLSEIPSNILEQKQLIYLDISNYHSNKNTFSSLPNNFFELTSLEYLNLEYCGLGAFSSENFKPKYLQCE